MSPTSPASPQAKRNRATIDETGLITLGQTTGEAVIVVRYMGLVDVSHVTVPPIKSSRRCFYAALHRQQFIDRLVYIASQNSLCAIRSLHRSEFIRRASLDAIGKLSRPKR